MDAANCVTITTTSGTSYPTYYPAGGGTLLYPTWYGYWYVPTVEPQTCIGKAHIFECAHEPKCKCGAIERVMAKPKRRA